MWKRLYQLVIACAVVILVLRGADWLVRRGGLPACPQPNGYQALLSAAAQLEKPTTELAELRPDQVRELAARNHDAVERARKAMSMESRVTLEAKRDWQDRHEQELKDLKRLAVAFAVEMRWQILDGRTNEAARCNLEVIRLGQVMARGGILVDGINGLTIETVGVASMQGLLSQLDAPTCRETARALEDLEASRQAPEAVLAMEKRWSAANFGLVHYAGGLLMRQANAKRFQQLTDRSCEARRHTQRLMLQLAARAFELENHVAPTKPAELVPRFLKAVPRDPESGAELNDLESR